MNKIDVCSGWEHHRCCLTIQKHRTGWIGVWDALKAAVTGNPRLSVPGDVKFSLYAKGDTVYIWGAQLEHDCKNSKL